MVTLSTLLSDRRFFVFNTRAILYHAKDLNLRIYYLEMLKEGKLIKSHNPESNVDNLENFSIFFQCFIKHKCQHGSRIQTDFVTLDK